MSHTYGSGLSGYGTRPSQRSTHVADPATATSLQALRLRRGKEYRRHQASSSSTGNTQDHSTTHSHARHDTSNDAAIIGSLDASSNDDNYKVRLDKAMRQRQTRSTASNDVADAVPTRGSFDVESAATFAATEAILALQAMCPDMSDSAASAAVIAAIEAIHQQQPKPDTSNDAMFAAELEARFATELDSGFTTTEVIGMQRESIPDTSNDAALAALLADEYNSSVATTNVGHID